MKKVLKIFWNFFTTFRILITIWNVIAICYHYFWIGIEIWTSIVFQITALAMEYILAYPYEQSLIFINRTINTKTRFTTSPKKEIIRLLSKSGLYTLSFAALYLTTYWLRLQLFYQIEWGVELSELNQSMTNMYWFTIIIGPMIGFFIVWRKQRKQKNTQNPKLYGPLSTPLYERSFFNETYTSIKY